MAEFISAKGIEHLKRVLEGLAPRQEHAILFQLGDIRAVIEVDKTRSPVNYYYNDLTGRPVNMAVKKLIPNIHDVYQLTKQEIINQTLTTGRTDHIKNQEEALAEISINKANNAWEILKVSDASMFRQPERPEMESPSKAPRFRS